MDYTIRPLSTYEDFKACEHLQAQVFGYKDIEVLPYQILQSFAHSGGIVLGAFDGHTLIGTVVGYTGLTEQGKPYHRSQRLAVLLNHRGIGVGEALKRAQADAARQHGLDRMCWTYDPLRSANAHLNIHKLGATSRRYFERIYATSSSPLDAGVPIDRLWVEWNLTNPEGGPGSGASQALDTERVALVLTDQEERPSPPVLGNTAPVVIVQIPASIEAIREGGLEKLIAWRNATRDVFTHYFARGYVVHDYVRGTGYLLARTDR